MVLRDRDDNGGGGWSGASDGTLESRIYYAQNWRADVSAILSAAGVVKEWVKYSSYGVPTAIDPGDFDRDGFVTGDDNTAFDDAYTNGRPKADLDFDGYVTGDDNTLWDTYYSNGQNLGRGTLSRSDLNNRAGYAGYQLDPTFTGSPSGGRSLYHVRHRVLDSGLGRWTRRDPAGYVDSASQYNYVTSRPLEHLDPLGDRSLPCVGRWCQPGGDPDPVECCRRACSPPEGDRPFGINYCCNGKLLACVCDDTINSNLRMFPRDFIEAFRACVQWHEDYNTNVRRCAPGQEGDPTLIDDCAAMCNEWEAYKEIVRCVSAIPCPPAESFGEITECERYKATLLRTLRERAEINRRMCERCTQACPGQICW